jgi:hypothetical protein
MTLRSLHFNAIFYQIGDEKITVSFYDQVFITPSLATSTYIKEMIA